MLMHLQMWILEVFPEFKQRRGYFDGQSIPRFLGWQEGQKLMKGSVDGILANAIKVNCYIVSEIADKFYNFKKLYL